MRFTYSTYLLLAAGSLTAVSALPLSTSEHPCMSTMTTSTVTAYSILAPRQEWDWTPVSSVPEYGAWSTPIPTYAHAPEPSAVMPSISYSYTNMPTATAPTEAQEEHIYSAPRDKFGTGAALATFSVIGIVLFVIAIWAFIAHRNGRRPFACFGGHKKDAGTARSGSMDSDIPFAGAGRHFDHRPVSAQPQLFPMTAPQRPQPAKYQMPRHPDADWVAVFGESK
jgi:hypothetical protein